MTRPQVYVVDRGRRGLCFRWKEEGRWKEQKCETNRRSAAERAAVEFAIKLERDARESMSLTWSEFCNQYEDEHVDHTSTGNQTKWGLVRRRFQEFLNEKKMAELPMLEFTPKLINGFRARLRKDLKSPASVASYFATFKAGLSYATELEIAPVIPMMRQRNKGSTPIKMRGRPVTTEEFERMIDAVHKVVGRDRAKEFQNVLKMLWLGGLRRSEALKFHTERLDCHRFDGLWTDNPEAVFHASQKNKKTQRVAMTKDWAEFVRSLDLKPGWVCNPINDRGWRVTSDTEIGRYIAKFGREAKVIVIPGMDDQDPSFATAQNLRQGFGYRWATRVMPVTLMHLMRHSDIKTTMQFYAAVDAKAAAADMDKRALMVATESDRKAVTDEVL